MACVVLFHSVYGLRPVEIRAAERFRAAGHRVLTPDLYEGRTAATLWDGFALNERIGWNVIEERAHEAVRELPGDTVLAGVSMGAGVVDSLLPYRPGTAGVLLMHGLAGIPPTVRRGLPVQLHVADPDSFAPPEQIADWRRAAIAAGAVVNVFTHPRRGHFYTDPDLPEYDEHAATLTWRRAADFLRRLSA